MLCLILCASVLISLQSESSYEPYVKDEKASLSYRQLENGNLIGSIVEDPVSGIGFGKEMNNEFGLVDIASVYPRYLTVPHNQLLAMWAYGGTFVFASLSVILTLMLAYSIRPYHLNWSVQYRSVGSPFVFLLCAISSIHNG